MASIPPWIFLDKGDTSHRFPPLNRPAHSPDVLPEYGLLSLCNPLLPDCEAFVFCPDFHPLSERHVFHRYFHLPYAASLFPRDTWTPAFHHNKPQNAVPESHLLPLSVLPSVLFVPGFPSPGATDTLRVGNIPSVPIHRLPSPVYPHCIPASAPLLQLLLGKLSFPRKYLPSRLLL